MNDEKAPNKICGCNFYCHIKKGVWCRTGYSSMGPLCGLRLGQNASLTLNNNNQYKYIYVSHFRYFHLLTGDDLSMDEEKDPEPEDCSPHYLSPHAVRPNVWNYAPPCDSRARIINFSQPPPYHHLPVVSKVRTQLKGLTRCFMSFVLFEVYSYPTENKIGKVLELSQVEIFLVLFQYLRFRESQIK